MINVNGDGEGFGYDDVLDIKPKELEWLIKDFLPKGFGFLAGPPKGENSPHGGKSILSRLIAIPIVSGSNFLNEFPSIKGDVLMVNLDEMRHVVSQNCRVLAGGDLQRGIKISKAISMSLPGHIFKLEADIRQLKPSLTIIDPLLRTAGGKDLCSNSATGLIIDELRRLQRQYDTTIMVIHHSTKNPDRDRESTASWLSGSTDLDSSWDFCFCLDWEKKKVMHLRCFYRHVGRNDLYYLSKKDEEDNIIGLELVDEEGDNSDIAKVRGCLCSGDKPVNEIEKICGLSQSKIKRILLKTLMPRGEVKEVGKVGKAKIWGLIKQDTVQGVSEQKKEVSVQVSATPSEQNE